MDSTTITGDFEFLSSVALGGGFVPNAAIISGAAYARPNLPPLYPSPGRLLAFDMVWANNVNLKTYLAEFWGYYWMLESARTEAAGLYIP
ncbi:MAG TPA: hypothetical protein EYO33_22310 [Phycisphaerales bacterium]|nr:hypothetical protein [Phycisphaerales bacterium]